MTLGVGMEAEPRLADRAVFANAGEHIRSGRRVRAVHMDIIGRHQRDAGVGGELCQGSEAVFVIALVKFAGGKIDAVLKVMCEVQQGSGKRLVRLFRRQCDDDLSPAVGEQFGKPDPALSLRGALPSHRQQPRQPAIGGAVGGKAEETWRILQIEPGAHHQPYPNLLGHDVRADYPRQRIPVGNADRRQPQRGRRHHQFLRVRGAAQEAEVGRDL